MLASGMTTGLVTHTKVIQEPLVVRVKDRRPQEDPWRFSASVIQEPLVVRDKDRSPRGPLAVHCFCVCSDIALLGDLRVNRTVERDFLFILSIYQRIFLTC